MTLRTIPLIEGSPANSMAAVPNCASSRNWCSGSAAGVCLRALGIKPEVCHLNEGHAAFAVLERARGFMEETGQPFDVALAATRAGNLFTTHTAVAAGFDRFPPALIEQYLGGYATQKLGISTHDLLALGRQNPDDSSEAFNMAYLAIRGSGAVNGVSRLHGQVSRHIFQPLFPRWPRGEVPVGYVTNGVHMPTWDFGYRDKLWTEACGKDRWLGSTESLEQDIRAVSDEKLWQFRNDSTQVSSGIRARPVVPATRLVRRVGRSGRRCQASLRPQCADTGLRAPLRYLQETRTCCCTIQARLLRLLTNSRASGATHHRRQGPSGGPGRAGLDPRVDPIHPAA